VKDMSDSSWTLEELLNPESQWTLEELLNLTTEEINALKTGRPIYPGDEARFEIVNPQTPIIKVTLHDRHFIVSLSIGIKRVRFAGVGDHGRPRFDVETIVGAQTITETSIRS